MIKNDFILFPTIHKIGVYNYPIFTNSWITSFKNGLNLFLGANSIGKTTTINMVVYGIIGDFNNADNTQINTNYFQERLLHFEKATPSQTIEVEFSIGKSIINIQRNLKTNAIEKLKITENGQEIKISFSEYEKYLINISKIDSIEDLAFVLSYLIIREEEGNYLLWQKYEQSKIFSILLNQAGFYKELTLLRYEFEKSNKEHKSIEDKFNLANDRLQFFEEKQKQQQNHPISIGDLRKKLNGIIETKTKAELNRNKIQKNTEKLSKSVIKAKNIYTIKWKNITELQNLKTKLSNEINEYQYILFNIQFKSSTINLTKNKLINNRICTHCEATLTKNKAEKIYKKIVEYNLCPVCDNILKYESTEKSKEELIELISKNKVKIEAIDFQLKTANPKLQKAIENKNKLDINFNKQNEEYINTNKNIHNLSLEITSLNNQIFELSKNKKIKKTDYDLLIHKQIIEIKEIKKELIIKEKIKAQKRIKLQNKNDFNNRIGLLTEDISIQFKKYAKEYFKQSSLESKTYIDKYDLKTVFFVPKIDSIERRTKSKVSQSEKVFLEYLFRLAVIELYYKKSNHRAFLMLETSEGVFDISNTEQVARLFSKFGGENFPVVIVTNLSKEDFLTKLKPKNRFNLIKFGNRLSERQKKDLQDKLDF